MGAAEDPFAVGEQISLVSAMQARNSARFAVLGSVEVLENTWFDATVKSLEGAKTKTANREFAKQLTSWVFKETGVLQVGRVEHFLTSINPRDGGNDSVSQIGFLNPQIYRIKNEVVRDVSSPFREVFMVNADHSSRPTTSSSPNMSQIIGLPSRSLPRTPSNLNSPCYLPFIAFPSRPPLKLPTARFTA